MSDLLLSAWLSWWKPNKPGKSTGKNFRYEYLRQNFTFLELGLSFSGSPHAKLDLQTCWLFWLYFSTSQVCFCSLFKLWFFQLILYFERIECSDRQSMNSWIFKLWKVSISTNWLWREEQEKVHSSPPDVASSKTLGNREGLSDRRLRTNA